MISVSLTDGVYKVGNNDPIKYIFAGNLRIAKVSLATGTYYFHKDHLGSSSAMTTSVLGSVQEESNYMPFGELREHTGLTLTNYKFTDQELDPETGLYNYGARLYDVVIGRFISPDTIVPYPRTPQSLNRYSYARNNPLIYVDPTGHYELDIDTDLDYDPDYYDPDYYGSSDTESNRYSLGTTPLTWNDYSFSPAFWNTSGMTQNTGLSAWYAGGAGTSNSIINYPWLSGNLYYVGSNPANSTNTLGLGSLYDAAKGFVEGINDGWDRGYYRCLRAELMPWSLGGPTVSTLTHEAVISAIEMNAQSMTKNGLLVATDKANMIGIKAINTLATDGAKFIEFGAKGFSVVSFLIFYKETYEAAAACYKATYRGD